MVLKITVNGEEHEIQAPDDTPLLYVLRNELELNGPLFGCGLSQCGACAVLKGKKEIRSCVTPVSAATDEPITTIEGLPRLYAEENDIPLTEDMLHPIQQAWIDEQASQCGYCQNGMMIQAADLLDENPEPSDDEIRADLNGHLCRCGTHMRIMRAVKRAAEQMR